MELKTTVTAVVEEAKTTKRNLKTKIIVKVFGELGLMILKNSFFKNLTQEKLKIYGLLILCQVKDQF